MRDFWDALEPEAKLILPLPVFTVLYLLGQIVRFFINA